MKKVVFACFALMVLCSGAALADDCYAVCQPWADCSKYCEECIFETQDGCQRYREITCAQFADCGGCSDWTNYTVDYPQTTYSQILCADFPTEYSLARQYITPILHIEYRHRICSDVEQIETVRTWTTYDICYDELYAYCGSPVAIGNPRC